MVEALAQERLPWAIVSVVRASHHGRTVEVIPIVANSVPELRTKIVSEWDRGAEDTWIEASKHGVSKDALFGDLA